MVSPEMKVRGPTMANILKGLMLEKGQAWLLYPPEEEADGKSLPKALIVTTVLRDPLTGGRSLNIYGITPVAKLERDDYIGMLVSLRQFARETLCFDIILFARDEGRMQELTEKADAEAISILMRL